MAIRFTENVYCFGVPDEVAYSLLHLERVAAAHCDSTVYITSMVDSRHGRNSLHYYGGAWDADLLNPTPDPPVWRAIRDGLREELGSDWDVITEDLGGENEHLHAELERRGFLRQRMEKAQHRLLNRIRGQPG